MARDDWEKWIPIVEQNRKTLEKIETRVTEIHDTLYKGGMSAKVDALWNWKSIIEKVIIGIVITVISAIIITYVSKPDTDRFDRIESKLEKLIDRESSHGKKR